MSLGVRWLGHACFLITLDIEGRTLRIVTDPYPPDMGPPPVGAEADVVTVSHEHFDHNHVAAVKGAPRVVSGLAAGGRDWASVDERVDGVHIRGVATFHDESQGRERGKNTIFVFEGGGFRFAHLGDLGHPLTAEQVAALKNLDVLLVPVGGFYTIDAGAASKIVQQVGPRIAIPMHYKTGAIADWPVSGVEPFLKDKGNVKRVGSNEVTITREELPAKPEVWVLE